MKQAYCMKYYILSSRSVQILAIKINAKQTLLTHNNHTCMSTYTYFAHDLDMGDPPTRTGHFIGKRRQNKVSWFRERLPHQERPGLITLTDQLLSIWT